MEDENTVPAIDTGMSQAIKAFTHELSRSVKHRVADVPYLE